MSDIRSAYFGREPSEYFGREPFLTEEEFSQMMSRLSTLCLFNESEAHHKEVAVIGAGTMPLSC